jgi:hypothetical protein
MYQPRTTVLLTDAEIYNLKLWAMSRNDVFGVCRIEPEGERLPKKRKVAILLATLH